MKQFHAIAIVFLATAIAVPPAMARTWVVDASHSRADDAGEGTAEQPFRSIGPGPRRAGTARPECARRPASIARAALCRPAVAKRGGRSPMRRPSAAPQSSAAATLLATLGARAGCSSACASSRRRLPCAARPGALPTGANPFLRSISVNGQDRSEVVRPAQGELRPVLGEVFVDGKPCTQVTTADALQANEASWMIARRRRCDPRPLSPRRRAGEMPCRTDHPRPHFRAAAPRAGEHSCAGIRLRAVRQSRPLPPGRGR